MVKTIDLTSINNDNKCKVNDGEAITPSPCHPLDSTDILYVPTSKTWYFISKGFADNLKKKADELDAKINKFTESLYDDASEKEARQAVLEEAAKSNVFSNYEFHSHLSFLDSDKSKKEYVLLTYTTKFLKTYTNVFKETGKLPLLASIKEYSGSVIDDNGLNFSYAGLAEDAMASKEILKVASIIKGFRGKRLNRNKKGPVLRKLYDTIKELERKLREINNMAEKNALSKGFFWYKGVFDQKFKFIKDDQKFIERAYKAYVSMWRFTLLNDELNSDWAYLINMYKKGIQFKGSSGIISNLATINEFGKVLPEQAMSNEQIITMDDEVKNTTKSFIDLLSNDLNDGIAQLIKNGDSIFNQLKVTWKEFVFKGEAGVPGKSLLDFGANDKLKEIATLGYFDAIKLSNAIDQALTNFIRVYIEIILGPKSTNQDLASRGFLYLMAVRYHINYLRHQARCYLKKGIPLRFTTFQGVIQELDINEDEFFWNEQSIEIDEYKFAWEKKNTHIKEFFILSEKNKPRYIVNSDYELLLKEQHNNYTAINLKMDVPISSQVETAPKKSLETGLKLKDIIAEAAAETKKNTDFNVNYKGELADLNTFASYTSAIHFGVEYAGGSDVPGAVNYTVSAEADFFRFSADSLRFEADYPDSLSKLKETMTSKEAKMPSFELGGAIDLFAGHVSTEQFIPNSLGSPLTIPSVISNGETEDKIHLYFGQWRVYMSLTAYGSVGVGIAAAGSVNMTSRKAGLEVTGVIPAEIKIPTGGSASVDLFAGIGIGAIATGKIEWQKPQQARKIKHRSWVQSISQDQLSALTSARSSSVSFNDGWEPLGRMRRVNEWNFGIGIRGGVNFGYKNREFVISLSGALTFGVGGFMKLEVAIHPENLLDILNLLTDVLADENFRRITLFSESDPDDKDSISGYKAMNALITAHLLTGIDIAQLALLDMTKELKEQDSMMVREYGWIIGRQLCNFYDENTEAKRELKQSELKAWFTHLPPEPRGRMLYAMTAESDLFTDELEKKLKENSNPTIKYDDSTIKWVNKEIDCWLGIAHILRWWTSEVSSEAKRRQIEETFCRYNANGKVMLTNRYCNKLMPIVVWNYIKVFLSRAKNIDESILSLKLDSSLEHKLKVLLDDKLLDAVQSKIDAHFNEFYEEKKYKVGFGVEPLVYWCVKGEKLTSEQMLGFYHMTRSQVFSDEYQEFLSDPKKYLKESAKSFYEGKKQKIKDALIDAIKEAMKIRYLSDDDGDESVISALDEFGSLKFKSGFNKIGK